ncbi:MAG: acetolactate synthase [Candidatus Magasanikbacteria bacterium RIFCSPHIGHO2_01_FULL_41_23]|uniref:Acetolactate synthase n=1 Tax=Candidatus Magasanikbacteria bacterium RIFCSPLOWO2_01_FULL_40_15 TaxID=1798686 RepID=A0A1F6N4E0_9BACT|nr:MAG: acetolactate synthase [Candidatus Magasanikbacteria bacterium RIFCSPHIGHO2_01_FULL_41_23]OGH66596.1 MAG: acetolactate synthase [Candidatus Magasanikbacteria bacterium RIFCSPHIGHO2_02_FULL_41_35]OGH78787.1 MAG: acetolactate synthase [Candidatus Magasanikbacteria bacterium RIFCSPLOWO2_01_FULL_40_15]
MKASDLLVKTLENEGVEYIFGLPGEENLDFVESLRTSKIKLIVTRHEQAAGFMAATYGRLTGKTGVCLSTLGPGATNLVTAAAYAQLGAMPMLMITGQKPIKKSKQGQFQIVDVVGMMRPLTKFAKQIVSAYSIPSTVREAFRIAEEERPGAVHLELPEDIAAEDTDATLLQVQKPRRPVAEDKAIARAVEMITTAKHPLILIGAGANRKLVSKMLGEFIDKTGIPFFCTQMGKGVVDERHPLYLGTAALSVNDFLHCAIDRADLIINIGHDVVEKPPFIMRPDSAKVIHLNFLSAKVDEVYFPQLEVIGDIGNALWQIKERLALFTPNVIEGIESLKGEPNQNFDYFLKVKTQIDEHLARDSRDERFPIIPQRIVEEVRTAMPSDGILTLDNGMYKLWFARYYRAHERNTILLDNALATMGAGLPSAMAAALIFPNKKILSICGDGGFMMNSQELETALRLKLNLTVLILNDSGYGMIKWKQDAGGFGKFGLDFGNPDFVKYAEAYGANGYRVTKTADLKNILEKCLNQSGVHIIEVPIDYSENERVLTNELRDKACLI